MIDGRAFRRKGSSSRYINEAIGVRMIRKLILVVLIAGLSACTTPGQRTSTPDADSTTSSTTSGTAPSGSTDSGSYGGTYGGGYTAPFSDGGQMCDAQSVQNLIGTQLTSSVENQIKEKSSSSKTRVLKPGEVMTMEYDPRRINLILDQQGALTALRCG
jgi:hypothetical protein